MEYVGETQRALKVRKKEHENPICLGQTEKSAVAEHVHSEEPPHDIDWQNCKVINGAKERLERKIREAFEIQRRRPGMNRDEGIDKSAVWNVVV